MVLSESTIGMPTELAAGAVTLRVKNEGQIEHNIVATEGFEKTFEENIPAGETREMQMESEPGQYTVFCPVGEHESRGMAMQLTVN